MMNQHREHKGGDKDFRPLHYQRKMFSAGYECAVYHVYEDESHYVKVQASTATQAIERSGIENVQKIIKFSVGTLPLIERDLLKDDEEEKIDA